MHSTKKELFDTLDRIRGLEMLVVGDVMIDRYIMGSVDRISPEAPVPVVLVKRTEDRLGGAGNVVRNLRSLGVEVTFAGYLGDDDDGRVCVNLLESQGVPAEHILLDASRRTTVKTRVIAHSQQVVRIDQEDAEIHPAPGVGNLLVERVAQLVEKTRVVLVSDYAKGVVSKPLMDRLFELKQAGKIGLGIRPLFVDPKPLNYGLYRGISIAKPNRGEAEKAAGIRITSPAAAFEAAKILLAKWDAEMILVTLGEMGLVILGRGVEQGIALDTVARNVFDVSGAGDTISAVFAAATGVGAPPRVAGDLANIAAGVVVGEVGTVPVSLDKLKAEIELLGR